MIATVVSIEDGNINVRVRRNSHVETLHHRHNDLSVGDRIEVKRQTNNPFLIRIK